MWFLGLFYSSSLVGLPSSHLTPSLPRENLLFLATQAKLHPTVGPALPVLAATSWDWSQAGFPPVLLLCDLGQVV